MDFSCQSSDSSSQTISKNRGLFRSDRFIQNLAGEVNGGSGNFWNHPLHLAGFNFILRDAAWFARGCLDYWRRATLQLARSARRYQDVPIIAVKPFYQLH
jgi:hypothetical protein